MKFLNNPVNFILVILSMAVVAIVAGNLVSRNAIAQHGSSGRYSNVFVTHAYESQVGTSTNVLAITPGIINVTGLQKTQRAYIAVTGTTIRWTADGTTPSGTVGNPSLTNSWLEIIGWDDIDNFQWTQDGGAGTSTLYINLQYEKEMK
jgi:hypothetical protein